MTTRYFKADTDAKMLLRSSQSRMYSHAWIAEGVGHMSGKPWQITGFASTRDLAHKAAYGTRRFDACDRQVVPAIEITRAEYTALRKASS